MAQSIQAAYPSPATITQAHKSFRRKQHYDVELSPGHRTLPTSNRESVGVIELAGTVLEADPCAGEHETDTAVSRQCVSHQRSAETSAPVATDVPRTVLICHADDALNREGLARWLAATTSLAAVIVLEEPPSRMKQRIRREIKRVGWWRFADVLAFRFYYKLFLARRDRQWEDRTLMRICAQYTAIGSETRFLHAPSPNAPEVEALLKEVGPDLMIARCKTLLKESVFSIPRHGTFVMHPGICPQYRNAHGCFWALAQRDRQNVGMTLLKINRGVDTGPVHGYFRCQFDEHTESHHVIQHKVVFDNLDTIQARLLEIHRGASAVIDTRGLPSGEWGQPWLTSYIRYRLSRQRPQH